MKPSGSDEPSIVHEAHPLTLPHHPNLLDSSSPPPQPQFYQNRRVIMTNIISTDEASDAAALAKSRADAQEECDRRNNPVLTDSMRETIKYIHKLYDAGAKLWTKDMFLRAEAALAQWPPQQFTEIQSMNGRFWPKQIPEPENKPITAPGRDLITWSIPSIRYYLSQDLQERVAENEYELNDGETLDNLSNEVKETLATRAISIALISYVPSTTPFDQIQQRWQTTVDKDWPNTFVCAELSNILEEQAAIPGSINKVVCFGLGSLGWSIGVDGIDHEQEGPALLQHAAAMTIASVIGKRLGRSALPVFCQDPIYSNADKEVLASIGVQVVGGYGGLGFTLVDEDTVVFSCSPNIPVKQVVADIARPAIMIWNQVREERDDKWKVLERDNEIGLLSPYTTDHDSPRTRELVKSYDKFPFPEDMMNFGDLRIYVRKD